MYSKNNTKMDTLTLTLSRLKGKLLEGDSLYKAFRKPENDEYKAFIQSMIMSIFGTYVDWEDENSYGEPIYFRVEEENHNVFAFYSLYSKNGELRLGCSEDAEMALDVYLYLVELFEM